MSRKALILMGVYGRIAEDARVVRSAQVLASRFDVVVVARASARGCYCGELKVVEIGAGVLDRAPFLRLAWFWVRFIALAVRMRPAVVYAHDFYMAFPGRIAAALSRAKLVYDAHELIITTRKNPQGIVYRLFCLLERFAVHSAVLIIAANRYRARLMKKYYGLNRLPVPIRNIPSPAQRQAHSDVEQRFSFLRSDGRKVIIYEGNVAFSRGVHHFVNAMSLLRDDCVMVLVGQGTGLDAVRQSVARYGLGRDVILLDNVPHADLHTILGLCHIGIVTYSFSGLNNIYCSPNKLFEYAYAGLPVVSSGQRVLRQVVERYRIGECLSEKEMAQPETVAATIRRVLQNIALCQGNLTSFLKECNWDHEGASLVSGVTEVMPRPTLSGGTLCETA